MSKPKRTRNSPIPRPNEIAVTALYGHRTRLPLVNLKLRDVAINLELEEARDLAASLLECAEAAEGDGFLVTWMREHLHLDDHGIAVMLGDFRTYRRQLWQQYHEQPDHAAEGS